MLVFALNCCSFHSFLFSLMGTLTRTKTVVGKWKLKKKNQQNDFKESSLSKWLLCLSASVLNATSPHPWHCGFAATHITWETWNLCDISEKDNWVTWRQVGYMDSHTLKDEHLSRLSTTPHGNFETLEFMLCCYVYVPHNHQQR